MAKCAFCADTGESVNVRGKGIYDCTAMGCTAAQDRTAMEEVIVHSAHPLDAVWMAYQMGKAAALEQAVKAVLDEAVENTGMDGDVGYNMAIRHAAKAIRSMK